MAGKNPETLLRDSGFTLTAKDGFVKSNPRTGRVRTRYVAVDGGFTRFEMEDGAWRQYPYKIAPEWEGVGGLAFDAIGGAADASAKVKPECFDWVYPASEIQKVYGATAAAGE